MDELAQVRKRRREKDKYPGREPDVSIYLHLRPDDPGRVDWIAVHTRDSSELHADDWQGARKIGDIIHSSWWSWMNWDQDSFEQAWRTEPVFSITSTRDCWLMKTSTEFEEEESGGTLRQRLSCLSWMLRTWWDITRAYAKFVWSSTHKRKEKQPWQKQQ